MYYEDVEIKKGDTLSELVYAYGYKGSDWITVWNDAKNSKLKALRKRPELIQPNDIVYIPIPWTIKTTTMVFDAAKTKVQFQATRDGLQGSRLRWVQTVDRGNQPFGNAPYGAPRFVVDPSSPPDDNQPFYYTDTELTADPKRRTTFSDAPFRHPPLKAKGTTEWRAMLSIGVVTDKRVTVLDTHYWGFDKDPKGVVTKVPAKKATQAEVDDHLALLKDGFGLKDLPGTKAYFKDMGWTFRKGTP